MFSFPISVKDLGERPLTGLLSGALLIYSGLWFAAATTDLAMKHRLPVGPARWALQTLSSHGAYAPSWLERGLLEPRPSVWLLVIPAVLANYWRAPYGIRVALILLSLEWCGLRETAISYLVVAARPELHTDASRSISHARTTSATSKTLVGLRLRSWSGSSCSPNPSSTPSSSYPWKWQGDPWWRLTSTTANGQSSSSGFVTTSDRRH